MQIVIDISDEQYEIIKKIVKNQNSVCPDTNSAEKIILNGTPLPKGHGRLIDVKNVRVKPQYMQDVMGCAMIRCEDLTRILADAPTIIEADKAESEE